MVFGIWQSDPFKLQKTAESLSRSAFSFCSWFSLSFNRTMNNPVFRSVPLTIQINRLSLQCVHSSTEAVALMPFKMNRMTCLVCLMILHRLPTRRSGIVWFMFVQSLVINEAEDQFLSSSTVELAQPSVLLQSGCAVGISYQVSLLSVVWGLESKEEERRPDLYSFPNWLLSSSWVVRDRSMPRGLFFIAMLIRFNGVSTRRASAKHFLQCCFEKSWSF